MAVILTAFLGENLLPEGNMKKYAACLLSVIICMSMVSALSGSIHIDVPDIPAGFGTEISDTFMDDVLAEYKKKAETEIEKNCGAKAEITVDRNGVITHILFLNKPFGTSYLTEQMGVSENEIEIPDK